MSDEQAKYAVEVYNGHYLLTVITVTAKDKEEASIKAREEFFRNIKARVKKAYN